MEMLWKSRYSLPAIVRGIVMAVKIAKGCRPTLPMIRVAAGRRNKNIQEGAIDDIEAQLERVAGWQSHDLATDDYICRICQSDRFKLLVDLQDGDRFLPGVDLDFRRQSGLPMLDAHRLPPIQWPFPVLRLSRPHSGSESQGAVAGSGASSRAEGWPKPLATGHFRSIEASRQRLEQLLWSWLSSR